MKGNSGRLPLAIFFPLAFFFPFAIGALGPFRGLPFGQPLFLTPVGPLVEANGLKLLRVVEIAMSEIPDGCRCCNCCVDVLTSCQEIWVHQ